MSERWVTKKACEMTGSINVRATTLPACIAEEGVKATEASEVNGSKCGEYGSKATTTREALLNVSSVDWPSDYPDGPLTGLNDSI